MCYWRALFLNILLYIVTFLNNRCCIKAESFIDIGSDTPFLIYVSVGLQRSYILFRILIPDHDRFDVAVGGSR
jgi:hypothetical protein